MSQYPPIDPSPYSPPPVGSGYPAPPAPVNDAAKRAAILGGILGGLLLLCGGGVIWMASTQDILRLIDEAGMTLPELPPGVSAEQLIRQVYVTIGVVAGVIGAGMILCAVFVNSGSRRAAITLIVLNSLVLLVMLLQLAGGLIGAMSGTAAGAFTVCASLLLTALFVLEIKWLAAFVRNAAGDRARVEAMRQQYAAQYWQSQQLQQSYQQQPGGIGYATQPAPVPQQQQQQQQPSGSSDPSVQ